MEYNGDDRNTGIIGIQASFYATFRFDYDPPR